MAFGFYRALFGAEAECALDRDIQDWRRYRIAPWILSHDGTEIGVAGFRLGFGDDGLEALCHLLPAVHGRGLASEFLVNGLDYARLELRADRVFAYLPDDDPMAARRVLHKAGFKSGGLDAQGREVMRLRQASVPSARSA